MEIKYKNDMYADLAAQCYQSLQELATHLPPETAAVLPQAILVFWRRLAWADFMVTKQEQEIFERIFPGHEDGAAANQEEDVSLDDFLRAVAEHDLWSDSPIGRKIDSQLESFGYALLAADREFNDIELEVLQATMRAIRGTLFPSPDRSDREGGEGADEQRIACSKR